MDIPDWAAEAAIVGIVSFVFKVVFGLINKNEQKSDDSDERINRNIKEFREELKELERKFVSNDRELYTQVGEIREKAEFQRGISEGKKG